MLGLKIKEEAGILLAGERPEGERNPDRMRAAEPICCCCWVYSLQHSLEVLSFLRIKSSTEPAKRVPARASV